MLRLAPVIIFSMLVKFMKKQFLYRIFFAAIIFIFAACKDPIYHNISQEEEMLEPLIKGSPTNFVEFKGSNTSYNTYVASGEELYRYDGTNPNTGRGTWRPSRPGGQVFAIAATSTNLYALCMGSSDKKIIRTSTTGNNNTWSDVPGYEDDIINNIFAANDQLFIGAGENGSYYIFRDSNKILDVGHNMLNGAAYDSGYYYLSAKDQFNENGGAIYTIDESTGEIETRTGSFVGIINTGLGSNPIKAINRNGTVFNVTPTSVSQTGASMDSSRLATGGLAVWEKDGNFLLLAGRQDRLGTTTTSGFSHGYVEAGINANGDITGGFNEPGNNNISTVINGDNGRYRSTVGRYPVNHLFQASDGILFASTQVNGVFSYRDRRNIGLVWNAEE